MAFGVKHDCAKVLELKQVSTGLWRNGLNDTVALEDDLIFPLVKSADLKPSKELVASRYLLLPQRRITDDTAALAHSHPLTYAYLMAHASYLDGRRSSIYRRRPRFAVFGLGEYSFMPYKVAIAGLSKEPHFVLLSPQQGKPILVDDTCYQLAFKERSAAQCVCAQLNSTPVLALLRALTFRARKRPITKEILMRLDLNKLSSGVRI